MAKFSAQSLQLLVLIRGRLRHVTRVLWADPQYHGLAIRFLRAYAWLDVVIRFGRRPNRSDLRFNDFLYALKVSEDIASPLRKRITDKFLAKAYVEERLGPGTTVPTLAVLDTAEAIARFRPAVYPVAVKPTHSSGQLIRIGSEEEWQANLEPMTAWLSHDYFRQSLERNYSGLAKRVIVEPWLDESLFLEGSVHCRGGVPKVVSIIERYKKARQSYTPDRRALGVSLGFPTTEFHLTKWDFLDPVLVAAARLAEGLSYIRVDFYTDGQRLVFGELTSLPAAGVGRFYPDGGEEIFSAAFFASPP
ncbi:MAG: hypothetical protein C0524_10965 [Rhodobacter sp.]|nr:hypothetical protein [Rhodobacter sp.]